MVSVPMSNGTENWMRDWLRQLSLSMPLKVWNLASDLKLVTAKAAKLWMKLSGLKKTVILDVLTILAVLKVV